MWRCVLSCRKIYSTASSLTFLLSSKSQQSLPSLLVLSSIHSIQVLLTYRPSRLLDLPQSITIRFIFIALPQPHRPHLRRLSICSTWSLIIPPKIANSTVELAVLYHLHKGKSRQIICETCSYGIFLHVPYPSFDEQAPRLIPQPQPK